MKFIVLILVTLAHTACTSSAGIDTTGSRKPHRIYCSGSAYSWDTCYEQAGELCGPENYDVLDKYEDTGAFAAYQSAQESPDRRLIIECRE